MTVWRRTRLKYLASGKAGTWGSEPGDADADVYCVRAADFDRVRFRVSPERLPQRSVDAAVFQELALQPGDLVLEKSGGGADQPVGGSVLFDLDIQAICSNFATRLRPLAETDPRFLTYLMAAAYSRGVTASLAKQTTGIANLDVGAYMATSWRVPDAAAQRAIADYLDAETARIDVIWTGYRRQLGLLALRKRATVSEALKTHATGDVPVRRLVTTVTSGPRGWSGLEVEGATQLFLRIANVPADSISLKLEDVAFIDAPDGDESDRCRAKPGDVLTTITAAIGQVAVVPADLGEAYVSQHLALLRPVPALVMPEWLALALWSDDAQRQLDAARYGGTKQQLSLDDIREVRVPLAEMTDQKTVVPRVLASLESMAQAEQRIRRVIDLLLERRQALITAAVTGQLHMPGLPPD